MKNFYFALFLIAPFFSIAQCDIHFADNTIWSCANTQQEFSAVPIDMGASFALCDFNSASIPAGWSVSGGVSFGQPCLTSLDGSDYFWASASGSVIPSITTSNYNFVDSAYVSFDLVFAVQGGASPCEGPDLESEGVYVQYTIDGGITWVTFAYFNPSGVIMGNWSGGTGGSVSGPTPFTAWGNYVLPLPPGAISPNTQIKWEQLSSSGTCCDNWGIDNIEILSTTNNYTVNWSNGAIDTNSIFVSSTVDSSFIAYGYDSLGVLQCQDTCYLNIFNGGFDNGIQMISSTFSVGLNTYSIIDAYNSGCPSTNGLITVVLDTSLTFVNSSPPPASTSGDTLFYNYSSLEFSEPHYLIYLNTITSSFLQIGDSVSVDLMIEDIVGDFDTTDNIKNYEFPVLASYDPNDKKVYPVGDCIPGYVLNDQILTYTVRFQNTGTAPAINVRIKDVIDPALDPSTLKVVAASDDVYLNWTSASTVEFMFDDIMLPTESSSATESIGYVVFEIEQLQNMPFGTPITNGAEIYFDMNPAIITNSVLNTVTDGTHYSVGDTAEITVQSAYSWNGELLTAGGVYSQSIERPNDCDSIAILYLILLDEVGLEELAENTLVFYPNPSTGKVKINGFTGEGTIEVYSASGELVFSQNYTSGEELDLGYLAKGVYVVDCKIEDEHYRGRLILE